MDEAVTLTERFGAKVSCCSWETLVKIRDLNSLTEGKGEGARSQGEKLDYREY